ncbi:BAR-domain-containing protein [Stereum hirsutum FP-91666 SS1]|uniref:BAR-domain-containing protein n=1 Tax=Stereum hirsutum (strain FP-91666) TaxID=721885 RepID=UPI00044492D7|nr:BAR-domain-containing protein [Stereum hirsutum FP-91666 SS1]EIM83418.1 BAR-domain-containing protein [Stereum hirsutum FP-91666 SS1]
MKGFTKAIKRTPHLVTTKVGMSKKSADPEFDDYQRNFTVLEGATEKFLKDTKAFSDAVNSLFTNGTNFAQHFATIFQPIAPEYDILSKHPNCAHTLNNVDGYQAALDELRTTIYPELELIDSRVVGPVKELQQVLKTIRKMITKREHKLTDYDRFNNSLTKLRDKKEKSLSDEKNLFKLEQDFEIASNEYEYINTAMKQDMPRFMVLATRFIDPLFHSFFYMQLNIYYMLLEKLSGFAEGKYDITVSAAQIAEEYEGKRTESWQTIEELNITQRIVSTSKMVQQQRLTSGSSSQLGRTTSTSTTSSRVPPPASGSFQKKAPPPPPSSSSSFKAKSPVPPSSPPAPAAPPPYSPSTNGTAAAAAAAAKRAPPPPPPLKSKPKPAVQYVVALYDFAAQADGDLDFKVGDRIEVVERTDSAEDWWTGRLEGRQGVFPGNYVQDA